MIKIEEYDNSKRKIWDEYVMNHPEGTIFHLTLWKKVIEETFGHRSIYLLATKNIKMRQNVQQTSSNEPHAECRKSALEMSDIDRQHRFERTRIIGILPLFRIKSFLFGNYLVSLPFVELGGAIADDVSVTRSLFDQAVQIAVDLNCDYIELRNRQIIFNLPSKSLYYNFKREIFADQDQNLMALPRKARRMVRQGKKYGLSSEFGNNLLKEFYKIFAKSYHRLGTPVFSLKLFKNLLEIFENKVQILLIRTQDKQAIAGVLSFLFKDQVIPYYAGSLFKYRRLAPNDFMYWELMRYGYENGYKVFNFGRSKKDTGSYHFKRH